MNDGTLKQFAGAMLAIAPDITMSAPEIESAIKAFGLEHFFRNAGSHASELAETADLISSMGG